MPGRLSEYIYNAIATRMEELVQTRVNKWKSKGHPSPSNVKDWSKEICFVCGGRHLVQLRGKARCPNTVAEERGTAEANKANNTKCTYWVDKDKTQCGGSHSFEDHKEALSKFRKPKGDEKGNEKGKRKRQERQREG